MDASTIEIGPLRLTNPIGVGANRWGKKGNPEKVLKASCEVGVNFVDTAEMYSGSEAAIGDALVSTGMARESVIIATKYFPLPWHLNFSSSLMRHLDRSLKKLKTDYVDLLYLHRCQYGVPLESQAAALAEAFHLGKCRAVGVCNFSEEEMRSIHRELSKLGVSLAANQIEFSLLRSAPASNGLLGACKELGVAVVAWSPCGDGRLCCNAVTLAALKPEEHACATRLMNVAERLGKPTTEVALNWCICKGVIPLTGTSSGEHLKENAATLSWRLTDEEIAELDGVSLLDAGAISSFAGKRIAALLQHG